MSQDAAKSFTDHSLNDAVVPPPRHTRFLILVICAIFLPFGLFVIGASNAWMATDEEAMVTMERVSSLLHEHAVRSFETHEAMIMALDQRLSGLDRAGIRTQTDDLGSFVAALRHSSPAVAGLALVHPPGQLVLSSQSISIDTKRLVDPGAIKSLRDQNRRIAVSRASEPDEQGASQFVLARRLLLRGNEESLILSTFDTSFFTSFYDPLRRDAGDLIALVRDDGSVLARTHPPATETAKEAEEPARILKKANLQNSTLRENGARLKPSMAYVVRQVGDYPVYLVLRRPLSELVTLWIWRVLPYALLCFSSIAFMCLLIWRTATATQREQRAYAKLAVEATEHAAVTKANLRMRRLMEANVFGVITCSEDRIVEANDAFLELVGLTRGQFLKTGFNWLGKDGIELVRDRRVTGVLRKRGTCPPLETEIRLDDNKTVPVLIGATLYETNPFTWTCFVLDLTERREREAQQIFVMRELNHRTKNLLTVIRSIAGQLARTGKDLDDFKDRFNNRLAALASAHDALVESNWVGASLADLVHSQFSQFQDLSGGQIVATGPPMKLSPRAAQAIGMGLYELMTNAVKYGALSSPDGRILVTWDVPDAGEPRLFHMEWREHGGPTVSAPRHRGFGHIVIADMTARSLFGDVDYRFESDGVVWKIIAPLENVREVDASESQAA